MATSHPTPTDAQAWRRGVDLALDLLNEASWHTDEHVLDPSARNGRPQDNIVARYLREVREAADPRVELAFGAVLSDFISSSVDGAVPGTELLEGLARWPIATTIEEARP